MNEKKFFEYIENQMITDTDLSGDVIDLLVELFQQDLCKLDENIIGARLLSLVAAHRSRIETNMLDSEKGDDLCNTGYSSDMTENMLKTLGGEVVDLMAVQDSGQMASHFLKITRHIRPVSYRLH